MNKEKKKLIRKVLNDFKRHGGGSQVDPAFTESPAQLARELKKSFKEHAQPLLRKLKRERRTKD